MTASLASLFASDQFLPHGLSLLWEPWLVRLHAVSDALIAIAYYSMPLALLFAVRRGGIAQGRIVTLLVLFLLAGGTTHLLGVWTLWQPDYPIEGVVKAVTAAVSVLAAVSLWTIRPMALAAVPAPADLRQIVAPMPDPLRSSEDLQAQIDKRRTVESALVASEQRFREFAEIASDWLWEMDSDLRFTYISPRAAEISGVPAEQSLGRTREEVADTSVDPEGFRRHLADLQARRPFRDFVFARRTQSGELRYARVSGKPIVDGDGTFRGYRGVASDVTMQMRAEQRAAAAHARLVDAIEALPAGFLLFDKDKRLVLANSCYAEMYPQLAHLLAPGTPFEAIARVASQQQLPAVAVGRSEEWLRERLAQFGKTDLNVEVAWFDGRWFQVFERRTSEGGVVSVRLDITERKKAEASAGLARHRLIDAIESLPAAFMLFDKDEQLVLANRRHLDMYADFADVNVPGTKFETMVRAMARKGLREDAAHDPEAYVRERLAQFRGQGFEGEVRFVDGRWFQHVERRTREGGVVSVRTDITARKRAEEQMRESERRFRAVVDNAPLVIYLKDLSGRYLLINRAFEQWSDITGAQAYGRTAYDLYPKEIADSLTRQDRLVIATNAVLTEETALPHSDGTMHQIIATKFPINDADGVVTEIGGLNVDLTRIKHVEEQLRQAQKMEAVGQLTGGIAHDFNNLLTVVLGNLDEITERLRPDDALRPIAEQAVIAAERGAGLTQKLLAFARRQPLQPRPVDCNEVVRSMADLLRRTLGEQIEIRTELADALPPALADRGQVENALLNLTINARDAMSEGGRVVIETALAQLDFDYAQANPDVKPGSYVMLAVTDTGTGMTPEVMARAFEPFFTTKDVGKGSGMGLSMIYGFAKQSGGHVKLYSEVNEGTTVRLYLPVAGEFAAAKLGAGAREEGSLRARGGETVLVVEDDELVRSTTVRLLSELGYRVLEAMDAPTAFAIVDGPEKIDLLFSDVVLPGRVGGRQLAEEAVRRRPGLRVLFTSGYTQNSIVHHGRLDAGVHLLSKPYKKDVLARTLRQVIDGSD
jgi:PAS domain S-box-containing protein